MVYPQASTAKNQEQVRMRLTDADFGRMVVDVRLMLKSLPPEHKVDFDDEFLTAIAEQPNEILKCDMYLFLGYLDCATQFALSCGGGGGDTSLPCGRKDDEDDRRFAYLCMMQVHKMLRPFQPKRRMRGSWLPVKSEISPLFFISGWALHTFFVNLRPETNMLCLHT